MTKERIFLSYGRKDASELAARLFDDLSARYEVVKDDRVLRAGERWRHLLEDEIRGASVFLALLSHHSVRRAKGLGTPDDKDSVCLEEIALAHDMLNKPIVPVRVDDCDPPWAIILIQYLDFRDWARSAETYRSLLSELQEAIDWALEKRTSRRREFVWLPQTWDFNRTIRRDRRKFVGREWLYDELKAWRDGGSSRACLIRGAPGSGKTTFLSQLIQSDPESMVVGYYFCDGNTRKTIDPKTFVWHLAAQLAATVPGFSERLESTVTRSHLKEAETDAASAFEAGILAPLSRVPEPENGNQLLLVDALDEQQWYRKGPSILDIVMPRLDHFPRWLRLVATSSDEREVLTRFSDQKRLDIVLDGSGNERDVKRFIDKRFAELKISEVLSRREKKISVDEAGDLLFESSEGLFLYLVKAIDALVQNPNMDLHALPRGMDAFFLEAFEQLFERDRRDYEPTKRVLSVLLAAEEPLSRDLIAAATGIGREELAREILDPMAAFLPFQDGGYATFHHSLNDWLATIDPKTDQPRALWKYHIDRGDGHECLADAGWKEYRKSRGAMSDYMSKHLPLHLKETGQTQRLLEYVADLACIRAEEERGRLYELAVYWKEFSREELGARCESSFEAMRRSGEPGLELAVMSAGKLFLQVGFYPQAISFFRRALGLFSEPGAEAEKARALFCLGWCLRHAEQYSDALICLNDAEALFDEQGDRAWLARTHSATAMCYWHRLEDQKALEQLDAALRHVESLEDLRGQAETLNHVGIVHRSLGDYDRARAYLDRAMRLYDEAKDAKGIGKCLNSLGTLSWWAGDRQAAMKRYREADAANRRLGQRYVLGLTANNRGYVHFELGELEKAREAFQGALEIRRDLGSERYALMDRSGLALVEFFAGNVRRARSESRKVIRGLARVGIEVEDVRRVYYNHYMVMRDGGQEERMEAGDSLNRAKELILKRLTSLASPEARARFRAKVPLIEEILSAESV